MSAGGPVMRLIRLRREHCAAGRCVSGVCVPMGDLAGGVERAFGVRAFPNSERVR